VELLFSGALSVGSLLYFYRLATNPPALQSSSQVRVQEYGTGDAVFTTILVLLFLINILGSSDRLVELDTHMLIVGAIFSLLLLSIVLSFLLLRARNPLELFGLQGVSLSTNFKAACVGLLAALPLVYFIHSLCLVLLGAGAEPQPLIQFLSQNPSLEDRLLLIGTALVIAPVAEELIFRGYIFGVLRRYTGKWWALLISGLVFAAIHAHIPSLAGLFALAITLTLVYEGTGSLWAAILMHSLFNAITVVFTLVWPDLVK
jgi:membrane protease YdiL (CAAX protease family)